MKRFLPSTKVAVWLFWIGSLGLHGLILMVPVSDSGPPIEAQTVKVVERPRQPLQRPPSPQVIPKKLPVAKAKSSPKPSLPQRPPTIIASPVATPTPTPKAPAPEPSPSLTPAPEPSPEAAGLGELLSTFAKEDGATPGCKDSRNDCWRLENTQMRSVAVTLEERFEAQGYEIGEMDDYSETGMKIYKVSKPGKPSSYLHFFSTLKGTVYYLNSAPLSVEELEDLVGV